jgi:hypothetical protein
VTFGYLWTLLGRMCGTIDSGSCIRWVLGFGIKIGYDIRRPLNCCRSLLHILLLRFGLHLRMLTGDRMMLLGERGGSSVGKCRESDVESRDHQGGSPRPCRLRTNGLAPTRKYWTYWSHAGYMWPSNYWWSLSQIDKSANVQMPIVAAFI